MQSRAAVMRRERGVMGCEVMKLGLGFRKVQGHAYAT